MSFITVAILIVVALGVNNVAAANNRLQSKLGIIRRGNTYAVVDDDVHRNITAAACAQAHVVEEGPFWVDEHLNRADVTGGQIGVTLDLNFTVYNSTANACLLSVNTMVDIWQANAAAGKYSDEASEGTKGMTWLRGYQLTDARGTVAFRTIWPSWYSGRTTHIHVRIRVYDSTGKTIIINQTTQLFFDDNISALVFATYPYNTHTGRNTYNNNDRLYRQDLQITTVGDVKSGYAGSFVIGIPFVR